MNGIHASVLALAQATQQGDGSPSGVDYRLLWWPGPTLAVAGLCALFAFLKWRNTWDQWLASRRSRRAWTTIIVSAVVPLLIAILVDWIDVSDLAQGHITPVDAALSCVLALLLVFAVAGQAVLWWHGDQWDDRLAKAAQEQQQAEEKMKQADETLQFALEVGSTFLGVVGIKSQRIHGLAASNGSVRSRLRKALDPEAQIVALIHAVQEMLADRVEKGRSLRIAYFRLDGNQYLPVHAWDGRSENCLTSDRRFADRFMVNAAANRCLAVYAGHSAGIEIVEDADRASADEREPFKHFDADQSSRLKSIIVMPLLPPHLRSDQGNEIERPVRHLICVDTDQKGFFREEDREQYKVLAKNLSYRLHFEMEMIKLLDLCKPEHCYAVSN